MNACPHGHVSGLFGGSHPYLCNQSLNSDLLRETLYFFRVARLANSLLLSVTLDFFFLMSNFRFESVTFCLSVLIFLFIRVCSVSANSGSLFCNGSQMVCDHS